MKEVKTHPGTELDLTYCNNSCSLMCRCVFSSNASNICYTSFLDLYFGSRFI